MLIFFFAFWGWWAWNSIFLDRTYTINFRGKTQGFAKKTKKSVSPEKCVAPKKYVSSEKCVSHKKYVFPESSISPEKSVSIEQCVSPKKCISPKKSVSPKKCVSPEKSVSSTSFELSFWSISRIDSSKSNFEQICHHQGSEKSNVIELFQEKNGFSKIR